MYFRAFLWGLIIGIPTTLIAQITPPDYGVLYSHDEIPKIYITINPDSLSQLYEPDNWYSNHEYPAIFVFQNQAGTDTLPDIGLRFRGKSSRDKIKKSFKVSFNTFVSGRQYHGVEKLNLNAEANDPSLMRSRLCWDLFRSEGVVVSRTNHVELYVNGDYYGLYQNIEHIDEEFAKTWFGSKKGNLYKCSYPADLHYISSNPDDYKLAPFGERTYDLKTNEELDNYSGLAKFIGFLNQSNGQDFRCEFPDYFDVYNYLKVAAVDVLIGNWDGYIYNQNNFYLYDNPLTGKMEYIPYDTDNTWGIDWVGQDWTARNIYNWNQDSRPLYDRLMDEPEFRKIFSWHIKHLLDTEFNTTAHRQAVENLQSFITASALADPYRPLDFGFSENDFLNALTESSAGHVPYGIFSYADLRENAANNQLEIIPIAPIVTSVQIDFAEASQNLHLRAFVDGPPVLNAQLAYDLNGMEQQPIDGQLVDGTYAFDIPLSENETSFTYNVSLTGTNGLTRNAYCTSRTIDFNQPNASIVINEVLPSNQSGITDESGGHPDWIELYNAGTSAVNLHTYYLSDADEAPLKWNLPDLTMDAGDFLFLWADGSIEQGPLHTNFSMKASGDNIYLFKKDNTTLTLADKVEMPAVISDYSYGRETDGNEPWIYFAVPTPDASNGTTTGLTADISPDDFSIYPNPTRGKVFFTKKADFILTDIAGKRLQSGTDSQLELQNFSTGIYLLKIDGKVFKIQRY